MANQPGKSVKPRVLTENQESLCSGASQTERCEADRYAIATRAQPAFTPAARATHPPERPAKSCRAPYSHGRHLPLILVLYHVPTYRWFCAAWIVDGRICR